ncbi:hypothetical protein CQW23_06542 [Capsicum baccatum]|uniref:NB-ARC domain-containing protein n=1 Tax=Capsicum baccatum TaxID=33114 RepID=A0A2G2X3P7_CAPBA|nr:hypothetical protein CQW23_06542 [Capsicum baccatum]
MLQLIELQNCSAKLVASAGRIQEEQEYVGNKAVQVRSYNEPELKKLKLVGTRLAWEDLNIIGQWPNLEVLKLKANACRGLEWRPIEGGFHRFELH